MYKVFHFLWLRKIWVKWSFGLMTSWQKFHEKKIKTLLYSFRHCYQFFSHIHYADAYSFHKITKHDYCFSNEKVIFKTCKNKSVYCPYSFHFLILSWTQLKTDSANSIYILWENICCFLLNEITSICLFSPGLGLSASNLAHLRILLSFCLKKKKLKKPKKHISNT